MLVGETTPTRGRGWRLLISW